jgi:hypothetical protein
MLPMEHQLIVPPIDNHPDKERAQDSIQCVPIHIQRSPLHEALPA